MVKEIKPEETSRESAFYLWMKAPNPMVTLFKKINVTNLVKVSKKRRLKFNMLMDYCIGKAASEIKEFYILPVDDKLIQYDDIAVNTIVKNKNGEVNSCDLLFSKDIEEFNKEYLKNTTETAGKCMDRDLSADHMIIGTSTIVETEIEGAVNIYSGFNNPFIVWGRYSKTLFSYHMMLSFQFHHTQMDGAHAGRFLQNLQNEIDSLK